METEIPAMLPARETICPERFTVHSSRVRMRKVTKEEFETMNHEGARCAAELADAKVNVVSHRSAGNGARVRLPSLERTRKGSDQARKIIRMNDVVGGPICQFRSLAESQILIGGKVSIIACSR
jgi:hypothetical protein